MKNHNLKRLLFRLEMTTDSDNTEEFTVIGLSEKLVQTMHGEANSGCANSGCTSGTNIGCYNTACGSGTTNRGCSQQ